MATRRQDLEALEVNPGFRYIGEKIVPPLPTDQKTGKFYSQDMPADVAAQTGRTLGAAPTEAVQTASPVTYTVAERINRESTPESEIALFGGLMKSEVRMTKISKRSIMRSREGSVVTSTINNGSIATANILDSLRQAVDVAVDDIHRFQGRLMGACSWTAYRRMTRFSEVTDVLLRTSVTLQSAEDIRHVAVGTLATVLGLEEILVGDDDHWPADRLLVFMQPEADVDPAEEGQFARFVQYAPDDMSPVLMESYFEDDDISYKVQARVWDELKVLNVTAAKVLTGIDEGNVVTTTTT